jgi:hypothetical protein
MTGYLREVILFNLNSITLDRLEIDKTIFINFIFNQLLYKSYSNFLVARVFVAYMDEVKVIVELTLIDISFIRM